jgi:outer membrane protein OmpA-like peptidoglycan-associated protein
VNFYQSEKTNMTVFVFPPGSRVKNFLPLWFCLVLLCVSAIPVRAEHADNISSRIGSVGGRIFVDGRPQVLSVVAFFQEKNGPPSLDGGIGRVPEFLSRTNAEGAFKASLPVGRYYMGILERAAGAPAGPPRPGEKFYFAIDKQGQLQILTVRGRVHLEAGQINGAPHSTFTDRTGYFSVEGLVREESGAPVANVAVLGKSRLNIPRPEFISARTKGDGRYSLKLPAGRQFYLVARQDIASSRPAPGTHVGTYGIHSKTGLATLTLFSVGSPPPGVLDEDTESRAKTVSGRAGEVRSGVDIFMYPVPDPEKVKLSVQSNINFPRLGRGGSHDIIFEGSGLQVSEKSTRDLELWAAFLLGREELEVELTGYTDNIGVLSDNIAISEKRARVVADYLISRGVAVGRIKVSGKGPLNPAASNRTNAGRLMNRRVEVRLVGAER